jgi:phospholipid/cholesterol/gamma-HCH transport system substrate-binding protein
MELRYGREAIVGTLVIIAIAIFVLGTMWLSGRSIGNRHLVRVQFQNSSGLKRASPVTVSGVQVGRVEKIELVDVGKVIVTVSILPHIEPRIDASARIAAVGLVGDFVVEFFPGSSPQKLPKGQVVIGSTKSGFGDRASALSDRADSLMIGLQQFANKETAEDFRATLKALQGTLGAFQKTLETLNDPQKGASAEATRTLQSLQRVSARLDSTLADPAVLGLLRNTDSLTGNLASMTRQLSKASARLDTLLSGVNQGRGTIGKFATDSTLYYELRDLSAAMRGLVAELQKNPGKLGITVKVF